MPAIDEPVTTSGSRFEEQERSPNRPMSWLLVIALGVLGGYFLFAHGCHGDEDTEPFAPTRARQRGLIGSESLGMGHAHDQGLREKLNALAVLESRQK
jgi:hypothetical protein